MNWFSALKFFPVNWSYGRWLHCYFGGGVKPDDMGPCDAEGWQYKKCGRAFWRHGKWKH